MSKAVITLSNYNPAGAANSLAFTPLFSNLNLSSRAQIKLNSLSVSGTLRNAAGVYRDFLFSAELSSAAGVVDSPMDFTAGAAVPVVTNTTVYFSSKIGNGIRKALDSLLIPGGRVFALVFTVLEPVVATDVLNLQVEIDFTR